jgi:hypothetical protein
MILNFPNDFCGGLYRADCSLDSVLYGQSGLRPCAAQKVSTFLKAWPGYVGSPGLLLPINYFLMRS